MRCFAYRSTGPRLLRMACVIRGALPMHCTLGPRVYVPEGWESHRALSVFPTCDIIRVFSFFRGGTVIPRRLDSSQGPGAYPRLHHDRKRRCRLQRPDRDHHIRSGAHRIHEPRGGAYHWTLGLIVYQELRTRKYFDHFPPSCLGEGVLIGFLVKQMYLSGHLQNHRCTC